MPASMLPVNEPADSSGKVASVRLPADLAAALRAKADATGESISDLMRQGALMLLGTCPTCRQATGSGT